jgi:tetratricopeptide (TPR) repeat protein
MTKQKPKSKADLKPVKPGPVKAIIKKDYTAYWQIAGLILAVIVFIPSLSNGLVNWDDNEYIDNLYVNNLSLAGIVKIFSVYFLGNYHPLTLISLGIDHLIGGESPFMFHFTNLLLHLLNTFLVFLLVRRLTKNNLLALLTFILFGVHTLHVESVAWIAERKDVLYSFFFLVSLTTYSTYASGRKGLYYGLSLLFFLLSLLAKGQAVVLVVILPFIDYVIGRKWSSIKVLSEKIPFFFFSLIFSWVAFRAQSSVNTLHFEYFSLPERFAFASFGFVQYLIKSIIPFNLSAFYPYPPRLSSGHIPSFYWFYIISLPVFFIGSYFLFKRSKIYAFGLSLFFLSLLPLLQLIPFGVAIMADRYFYIPSIGLLLCFAFGLLEIRSTSIKYLLFTVFILIFSSQSFSRCRVWKDSITLWDDVISKYDYAQDAYLNRGVAYGNLGQFDKAIDDYSKAIELNPKYTKAYYNLGVAYANLGQWDKAIDDYNRTIGIDPDFTDAYYNRGIAYANIGTWDKAIEDYSRVIGIRPDFARTYYNRGVAYGNSGLRDKAIIDYTKAIGLDPKYTDAFDNRGVIYASLGQWDKAIEDYTKAIGINPDFSKAYYNRGFSYGNIGQWDKAIVDYSRAIEIDPKYAEAYTNRGVAYCNFGQWEKAIDDFSKAIAIDPINTSAWSDREFAYKKLAVSSPQSSVGSRKFQEGRE